MNIIEKADIKGVLGSYPFGKNPKDQTIFGGATYLGGINALDDLLENKQISIKSNLVDFWLYPYGMLIKVKEGFSAFRVAIRNEDINFIVIETGTNVLGKEKKSVLGRALVGGLLLGPVGSVVGGMTGIGYKEIKNKNKPENLLSISYNQGGESSMVVFSVKNKKLPKVVKYFDSAFSEKYRSPEQIEEASLLNRKEQSPTSLGDELSKLAELRDKGILSEEEFQTQKEQYLKISNNIRF